MSTKPVTDIRTKEKLDSTYIELNHCNSVVNSVHEILEGVAWLKPSSVTLNNHLGFGLTGVELRWFSKETGK